MQNSKSSNQKSGKALVGMIFLGVGCILLLKAADIYFIPSWILSWPTFMILIGSYIGSRQGFNKPSAFIPIIIGVFFLSNRVIPDLDISRLFWPLLIIGFGLWMILGRKRNKPADVPVWEKRVDPETGDPLDGNSTQADTEQGSFAGDRIESVSIFGGVKKNIVSKNFKGGEVVNFFGGCEINLMQADFNGRAELEVVQVFGGTKIIVPANWTIHSEMVAIFGGIEDKRPPQLTAAPGKVLVIQGTTIFGGIDIKSF